MNKITYLDINNIGRANKQIGTVTLSYMHTPQNVVTSPHTVLKLMCRSRHLLYSSRQVAKGQNLLIGCAVSHGTDARNPELHGNGGARGSCL